MGKGFICKCLAASTHFERSWFKNASLASQGRRALAWSWALQTTLGYPEDQSQWRLMPQPDSQGASSMALNSLQKAFWYFACPAQVFLSPSRMWL